MKRFVGNGDFRNSSTTSRAILLSAYLHTVVILCLFSAVSAEEDMEDTIDVLDDDGVINKEYDDDSWFMVLLMCLLFGFLITLFGAWIGYFSALEDKLMRRYLIEGETIVARVISSDFARVGGSNSVNLCVTPNNNNNNSSDRLNQTVDNPEYLCFCEYDRNLAHNYGVRVRKQCKARAWDFVVPPRPGSQQMLLSLKKEASQHDENGDGVMFVELPDQPGACCVVVDDDDADDIDFDGCRGPGVPPNRKLLEMLILPGHELSAWPKKAVQRACTVQYRFSTIGLILFTVCLALCCILWAIHQVKSLEDDGERARGWFAIIAFVVLVVLEIPLIHGCCHGMLVDALKEEYLDSGDFVPLQDDASSLSSGSDMFLASRSRSSGLSFQL